MWPLQVARYRYINFCHSTTFMGIPLMRVCVVVIAWKYSDMDRKRNISLNRRHKRAIQEMGVPVTELNQLCRGRIFQTTSEKRRLIRCRVNWNILTRTKRVMQLHFNNWSQSRTNSISFINGRCHFFYFRLDTEHEVMIKYECHPPYSPLMPVTRRNTTASRLVIVIVYYHTAIMTWHPV